jgi:serralysin
MLVHRTKLALAAVGLLIGFAPSAHAAFHLWQITQVYSNASGTLQFIEMQDLPSGDPFGFQNAVNGQLIQSISGVNTINYTVPSSPTLSGNTLNHSLLFGTAGIQAAGGPAPDFTIPNGFLFTANGGISFFGLNSNTYTALPTDGIMSYNWLTGGVITPNIAHNYSGAMGTVIGVPEPSTLILTTAGAGLFGWYRRRSRRLTPACSEQS